MSNLHLNATLVAQWPEEHRPEDPSSVELVVGQDLMANVWMGPHLIADLGENRYFVMAIQSAKAQIVRSKKTDGEIFTDPDSELVMRDYDVSEEVFESLDAEAGELMKVEDPEKYAKVTAEKNAREQAATS